MKGEECKGLRNPQSGMIPVMIKRVNMELREVRSLGRTASQRRLATLPSSRSSQIRSLTRARRMRRTRTKKQLIPIIVSGGTSRLPWSLRKLSRYFWPALGNPAREEARRSPYYQTTSHIYNDSMTFTTMNDSMIECHELLDLFPNSSSR